MGKPEQSAFLRWLDAAGGTLHPQLDVFADTGSTGRGVQAQAAIAQGQQLAKIPLDCCLHVRHKACLEVWNVIQESRMDITFFVGTVLALMRELCKGAASTFQPYLHILPQDHDCLLSWTSAEADQLKGTSIHAAAVRGSQEVFEAEAWPVIQQQQGLWPYTSRSEALLAFEACAGLVQTRSFHMSKTNHMTGLSEDGEELYLIPGIDMMNHTCMTEACNTSLQRSGPAGCVPVAVQTPGETSGASPAARGGPCFVMHAEKDIAKGGEILHSYGVLSDAQLLQTYGFVPNLPPGVSNPDNSLPVTAADVMACCQRPTPQAASNRKAKGKVNDTNKLAQMREMLLEELGLATAPILLKETDPVPDPLITLAQVMHMDAQELQLLLKRSRGSKRQKRQPDSKGPAVDADSPAAMLACQSLLRLFHERSKALSDPTTAGKMLAVAPQRQAAAERIRRWEQQIVEQAKAEALAMIMQESDKSEEDEDSDLDESNSDSDNSDT
ncbi:hypothetical protein WJX74_005732 [Apatococcus lobatus]|uniref:SET domain-containing protein n=1 Tax=Apatococcus lobatus TaxID=904363 RepID=A0AAW1RJB1_9CHLO